MSVEEAKVPHTEADWSIEIFLFSNGQHFSPPRKYNLRADKLNLWEDTLCHLAQSHYGLQCPAISLFTIDGKLVEGPLDLKDGHAYVAVAPTDNFIDAGYQKYLIRASRSWEKRQARKKMTECLPDDSCCLCPEKEWYCDPHACCECSEEDSYSDCCILPPPGHQELRPAGGLYMSCIPAKPASVEEYGPRSGRIGSTTVEHKVRLVEYKTRPVENGNSPVSVPAKPVEYLAGLNEYANKAEQEPELSENRSIPGEYKPISDESKLNEHGSRLSQNGEKPVETTVSENEPILNKDAVKAGTYKSGENVPRPADYAIRPSRNEAKPGENGAKSGEYGAKPDDNGTKPGEHETMPSGNGVQPNEYGDRPGAYEAKPIGNGATPDKQGVKPGGNKDRTCVSRAKPGEYETKPNRNEAKLGEHGTRPSEYKSRPSVNRAKPGDYASRSSEYEPRSNANAVKPDEHLIRPDECETKPNENGTRLYEHRTRPGGHETILSTNRARPVDSAVRPGKNEVCPGEDVVRPTAYGSRAEVEHTRRISGQKGADIQQGGRKSDPNREFEPGGRVSEQKGRETYLVGRAGGQKARENGARLSEQKNKQNDHLPKLGGRESKLGDHEARPCDLTHPASRVTEPSARTATPVPKTCRRDRINSRVRTSDLGQLKSRTPTRVDETAARSDDSGIKNILGHPGARPGSAGGTAGAGASHISEAQQHARRNSLLAGRPPIEKKRLSIGQNSTLLKKPTPIPTILRELEDKQPIKTNKDIVTKETNKKASLVPVPAPTDVVKSENLPECNPNDQTPSEVPLPTIFVTNPEPPTANKAPLENIIDETFDGDTPIVPTHSSFHIKNPVSEVTSVRLNPMKHVVEAIKNSPEGTQTDLLYVGYVGKSMVSDSMTIEVQTSTETVDMKQQPQEESASTKATVDSDTCCSCSQKDHKLITIDGDENSRPISNQGDGKTISLKLDIKIQNIVKSVYSCQKNCQRAQSLTTMMTTDKESQISFLIEDNISVNRDSLHSLFQKKVSRGYGFQCSPNVMVVQCAGCGRLNNPPRCDVPQCCDHNKKYFVLLTNSVNEDIDGSCNFSPPCRPSDLKQSQLRRPSSFVPLLRSYSNMNLDTITTVTVSGLPLQTRGMKKCCIKNSSCQTEESHECMITKRKVNITEESVATSEIKKRSTSSISHITTQAISLTSKRSCSKICQEILPELKEHECSLICSLMDPIACQKVPSACSQTDPVPSQKIPAVCCQKNPVPSQKEPSECSQTEPSQKEPSACSQTEPVPSQKESSACSQPDPVSSQKIPSACCQKDPEPCQKLPSACCQNDPVTCQKIPSVCCQKDPVPCQKLPSACCQKDPEPCQKLPSACCQKDPESCQKLPSACCQKDPEPCQKLPSACCQKDPVPCQKLPSACCQKDPEPCQKLPSACCQKDPVPCQKLPSACCQKDPVPCQKLPSACCLKDSQTVPVPCQKVTSACSKVCSHTCPKVQLMGCQHTCPLVQAEVCSRVPSICPPRCPVPLPCIQIQTQVCPHGPQVSNMETQTQWKSIILQARLHCDGRYSFHLPPLNSLNHLPF